MTRIRLALMLSIGFHAGFLNVAEAPITQHPEVSVAQGESRLAMVFVQKMTEVVAPEPNRETASEVIPAEETKMDEEKNLLASIPSEGVVWVEPQYLVNTPPQYPRRALLRNIQGKVTLIVDIDVDGKPQSIRVEKSSGFNILDDAAVKAVSQWVFHPAFKGDHAVRSRSRVPIQFVIKK